MITRIFLITAVLAGFCFRPASNAQEASKDLAVKITGVKVGEQNTPQYAAPNVVDKRFRPKKWLEFDVALTVKKLNPKDRNPMVDTLECKFFVALNKTGVDGKRPMLTSSVTFMNAIEREDNHLLMFASPASLLRLLEKDFSASDIVGWGVEVYFGGAVAGWDSSQPGKRWWVDGAAGMTPVDGLFLPKAKTPFAPLWGDYDLETKQ